MNSKTTARSTRATLEPGQRNRVIARLDPGDARGVLRPLGQNLRWTADLLTFLTHALVESERARALGPDERQILYGAVAAAPSERRRVLISLALDPGVGGANGPELSAQAIEYLRKERTRLFVALPDGEPFCLELLLASAHPIRPGRRKSKTGVSFADFNEQLRGRAMQEVFVLEHEHGSTFPPRRFLPRLREVYARLAHPLPAEVTTKDLNNEPQWAVRNGLTTDKDFRKRAPRYHPEKLPAEPSE